MKRSMLKSKTFNIAIIQALLLCLVVFVLGCGDEVDVATPTYTAVSYQPTPNEGEICGAIEPVVFEIRGGETLSFEGIFTDDVALSEYKVDIHNNFDCHGHGGTAVPGISLPTTGSQTEDWTVLEINDLSGTEQTVTGQLLAPQNITAGNYHFQLQVIDEAGNDDPSAYVFSIRAFNPIDEVSPVLTSMLPVSTAFTVNRGDQIQFKGTVTDNLSLSEGGNGVLFLSYTDLSSGNAFVTDQVFPFDETVTTSQDFDFTYTIPQTLTSGDYRFSLGATDGVRNLAANIDFAITIN